MALNAGTFLLNEQYRILRELGRGGFGSVYLAEDRLLGEHVAIKELIPAMVGDETMLKRFLAEARATIRLTHERIVRTYNVFSEGGNYYIAMEYMPGGSLADRLKAQGMLSVEDSVRVIAQVCEGLHYAHQRGVVHCDLKPANILFDAQGAAKVADFGIAHVSDRLVDRTWHTVVGFVAGTMAYMSPEQAEGVRDDPRIDVYALGAVLYRMLTGRSYFDYDERPTPAAQVDNVLRIRDQAVTPPSSYNRRVPPWLDAVVLKALAKERGERYASALALQSALLGAQPATPQPATAPRAPATPPPRPTPAPSRPAGRPARPQQQPRRTSSLPPLFWILAAGAVVLFLGIAVVVALLASGGDGRATPGVTMVVVPAESSTPVAPAMVETSTAVVEAPTVTVAPLLSPTVPPVVDTPPPPASGLVYQDDFSDPNGDWGVADDADSQVGYEAGEYRIAVLKSNYVAWGHPDTMDLDNVQIEVDTRLVEGPIDNNLGLLVHYQDATDNFYWFQISSDGYYAVDLFQDGQFVNLVSWQQSSAINQGVGATNHLRLVCSGSYFDFYVNNVHLTDLNDDTLPSGNIGLAVGTFDEPGVVVHFDNVEVQALDQ